MLLLPNAPTFTILDANECYLKATQTVLANIKGKGLFEVFPDNPNSPESNSTRNLRRSLENVLSSQAPDVMALQRYDIPLGEQDGGGFKQKYWHPRNTPVFGAGGKLLYILHQAEDVTDRVQRENKMLAEIQAASKITRQQSLLIHENTQRINMILEALLRYTMMDFTEKLPLSEKGDELDAISAGLNSVIEELQHHMQLVNHANGQLEYANKELDSFSYSVSHDLRAPLRAIHGYAQVLQEDYADKLDEEGKETIGIIMRNAFKMGNLIDDLLTFSRVGKQNLNKVTLNMSNLFSSIISEQVQGKDKDAVNVQLAPLENVAGDGSMIRQVITNLISNAIKYSTKKGQARIEVGCHRENQMAVFYVKDNGAGFDMKYYDKLFGVFQRLHSSADFEGTGVGLALVQRIIKKHGGEVWAEAKIDEGATFFFSLPAEESKT